MACSISHFLRLTCTILFDARKTFRDHVLEAMTLVKQKSRFLWLRYTIMLAAAALGLTLTLLADRFSDGTEQTLLMQRFRQRAEILAANVVHSFQEPLDSLGMLQRLFSSIEQIDRQAFHRFARPMFNIPGVRSFLWVPRITADERAAFEQQGQQWWGRDFFVSEHDDQGKPFRAAQRDVYFPVLHAVPESVERRFAGFNAYAFPSLVRIIDSATATGAAVTSERDELSALSAQGDVLLIAMPVYRGGTIPKVAAQRMEELLGVVAMTLDIETVFSAANLSALDVTNFHTSLVDQRQPEQLLTSWSSAQDGESIPALVHSKSFAFGSRTLTLNVEASERWVAENRARAQGFIVPLGLLVTGLLLIPLWILLKRSEQARWLEASRHEDVEQRRRAELWANKLSLAVEQNQASVFIADLERRIEYVNDSFVESTGYPRSEIIGQDTRILRPDTEDDTPYELMWEAAQHGRKWQGEFQTRRRDGSQFWERVLMSPLKDADGRVMSCVVIKEDITEREEARQRIEQLAFHDALTGLPNRLLLRDRFGRVQALASRMHSRVAMMYLDLDRFKTINDSLGHPIGDILLQDVVARLKTCVRESDTISRQGGDEFIILLGDVRDGDAVSRVADKIHQRMAEPFEVEGHLLSTSFSIGVALFPDDGEDFDLLLQKADTAMYHAKEAGRNAHRFFTEQMNEKAVERLQLETRLRMALENKEFVLHYQPQIDLCSGAIIGVEALIRWRCPEGELISPGRFIPVAEESGLIVPIGNWVLGEACRQTREWQKAGLAPFVVAVNLSAAQFRRHDLINNVINALVLSDLDSQWLELELTESIMIRDAEATLDTVRRLKALGVKLSVDDFGTGYSSLAYLKRFAVDKLKIDQSFVRDLVGDPEDAAIVRAIIQMAHSLKLKTIAEGVESEAQSELLREFQCDEIQGYWLTRPMPADELADFIRNYQGSKLPAEAG